MYKKKYPTYTTDKIILFILGMTAMPSLIHLIYSSAAMYEFSEDDLIELLAKSRANNDGLNVTGMLLYTEGSFFQILEGEPAVVDALFEKISHDKRHTKVVTIIRETIAKRSFGEWSMGYAHVSSQEVAQLTGMNDFFTYASCFGELDQGRAKKLLTAFKEGRWRTKVKNSQPSPHIQQPARIPTVSFAFQPIIDANSSSILSFEAIARGLNNETLQELEEKIPPDTLSTFDTHCRTLAIGMACRLGLKASLSLNFMARHIKDTPLSIRATLDAAERYNMGRIILEIDQDKLIGDSEQLGKVIEAFRGAGLKISINHFGAGRTGLNLLESHHPEMISLNSNLVQGIDSNSSRQAIVRGVTQTCAELGIKIIAKHVETLAEYAWLRNNGIHLFQGDLIGKPAFEQLPSAFYPAN